MDSSKAIALRCGFCGGAVVLGEVAQSVVFASGFTVPVVHARRCKESLYPGC